jgi:hypothetical protein
MVRLTYVAGWLLLATTTYLPNANAQNKNAYELLPNNCQAVVWIADTTELINSWGETQLAQLAADTAIRPFWEDQRQAVEKRFLDAGWRLNIKPQDLADVADGQFALAWMERSGVKAFDLALIVDLVDDRKLVNDLLEKIGKQLRERQAETQKITFSDETITKYTLKRPGELLAQETYYCVLGTQLLSADSEQLIKDLISRAKGLDTALPTLAADPVFIAGRAELAPSNAAHIEYFVRPIGFARVLRAIGGKRSNSSTDVLAVLQNQGFGAIKCVCGEIELGKANYDIKHRGFALADKPLPLSAAILDFPNKASADVPSFVTKNVSSMLVTYWNSQEAFWKAKGLVDDMAGQEGVFDEVIKGIKTDPNGPKIDIEAEVLPYITNDIYSITDTVEPITTDSQRNLIAIRVSEPEKLAAVLRRAMRQEPDTEREPGEQEIWKKVHRPDSSVESLDLDQQFGDFGAPPPAAADTPWLSSWAITVYGDYFMFASHVDMIKDAIAQSKSGEESPFVKEPDVDRVRGALTAVFGAEPNSAWQILRSDRTYRMQYELFRKGELKKQEGMLASILDRLLQNNSEIKKNEAQRVDGQKLPEFEKISHYLQPSGLVMRSTDKGWEFGSLLLAPLKPNEDFALPSTRVSNTEGESGSNR